MYGINFFLFYELFAPCGVILASRMVVDFNYHLFIVIFNERDSVPPVLEKQVNFYKGSIGSAH
jgi:hypothetical protein